MPGSQQAEQPQICAYVEKHECLGLAFDHRLVDGQAASRFLVDVGEVLADPTNLIAAS